MPSGRGAGAARAGSFAYEFPRPAVTVDAVVFGLDEEALKVLLIERGVEPFLGQAALPGGFVRMDESLEAAVRRELAEEAGLRGIFLEQLYTFGEVDRDPRDRIISVAYFGLVNIRDHRVRGATDARAAGWHDVKRLPPLAFDHAAIVRTALVRLQGKVRYQPIGFELLPAKFTLTQLQHMYETILGRELDRRNFRRKILEMGLLQGLPEKQTGVAHRAAQLFRFDREAYEALTRRGFNFEI